MTVRINKPAINLREELADLRNQGGYQEQQFYFDNLVTNGTFDSDTSGWSAANSGVLSVSSSTLRITNSGSVNGRAEQEVTTSSTGYYKISFDTVSKSSGSFRVQIYNSTNNSLVLDSGSISTAGSNTLYVSANGNSSLWIRLIALAADGEYAEYDNISVYPADPSDDAPWHKMPKGWLPLHVYEDGLLQREGTSHDYEVIYDGFDYYVKPSVAPGPNTETCVIGVKA